MMLASPKVFRFAPALQGAISQCYLFEKTRDAQRVRYLDSRRRSLGRARLSGRVQGKRDIFLVVVDIVWGGWSGIRCRLCSFESGWSFLRLHDDLDV